MNIYPLRGKMSLFYLLSGEGGMLLIDAGLRGEERLLWRKMRALRRDDLRAIFITHAHLDHAGAARAIHAGTGAPIFVHEADAGALQRGETHIGTVRSWGRLLAPFLPVAEKLLGMPPTRADAFMADGERFEIGDLAVQVVHTPGHTPGSCTLIVNEEHAFVGDLISGQGKPHAQRYYAHDWTQLAASVTRLLALPRVHWLYPGHGRTPVAAHLLARRAQEG